MAKKPVDCVAEIKGHCTRHPWAKLICPGCRGERGKGKRSEAAREKSRRNILKAHIALERARREKRWQKMVSNEAFQLIEALPIIGVDLEEGDFYDLPYLQAGNWVRNVTPKGGQYQKIYFFEASWDEGLNWRLALSEVEPKITQPRL